MALLQEIRERVELVRGVLNIMEMQLGGCINTQEDEKDLRLRICFLKRLPILGGLGRHTFQDRYECI